MPETKLLQLSMIDEPPTPVRSRMDDGLLSELMEDMQANGQLQAIGVVEHEGRYEIKFGHRRYVAASQLHWTHIRCEVWLASELNGHAAMIAENRYREAVNAADEAVLFAEHQLRDNLDEDGLCKRFHVSPDYLGDRMRLLRQDKEVFAALQQGRINFSVARELNKCPDEPHRRYLLDVAVRTGYSAAVMADHVRQWRQQQTPQPAPVAVTSVSDAPAPVEFQRPECAFCGGYRDPWNLVPVMVHKDELAAIQKQLRDAAQAE
jgi:ParB/RepB/Spo0J family partition protein